MTLAYAIVGLAAVVGSLLLTPAVIRIGHRYGLVAEPGGRRIHQRAVPRIGGMAVFAGTCAGLFAATFLAPFGDRFAALADGHVPFFFALFVGASIMFVTGVLDDAFHLKARHKLLAQVLGAVLVYALGFRIGAVSVGPGGDVQLDWWLGLPLTTLWIVGVTNAYNLIDGLDGLATGIALIALMAVGVAAGVLDRPAVLLVAVALSGALVGFLPYNFSPARIFLGDSGSLFIGFMLAVLSVHGSMKSATAVLTVVPLLALGVPLIDMGLSILRRWLRGSPVFGADARHIHHRLVALGLTHRRAVVILYALALALAIFGLLLAFAPPARLMAIALAGGVASAALVVFGLRGLNYDELFVASAVLASGPRRMKRVIRDRLHAKDIAGVLGTSASQAEIAAILADAAPEFGFLHMECVPEHVTSRRALEERFPEKRLWKLDFSLLTPATIGERLVLRIWCAAGESLRPHGAERVAHILAPALDDAVARVHGEAHAADWAAHVPTRRSAQRKEPVRALAAG